MLTNDELAELLRLLEKYRDDAVDREEFDKRESMRFDAEFELNARGDI